MKQIVPRHKMSSISCSLEKNTMHHSNIITKNKIITEIKSFVITIH